MKRFRIGNDITIVWDVMKNGKEVALEFSEVRLFITHARGREEIPSEEFNTSGYRLEYIFKGEKQSVLGPYTLTIDVREKGKRVVIQDKCKAFELVGRSCAEDLDEDYYTVIL